MDGKIMQKSTMLNYWKSFLQSQVCMASKILEYLPVFDINTYHKNSSQLNGEDGYA
jgi:hypothetical protein